MSIYNPAEDSYLMQEVLNKKLPLLLKENLNLSLLEIGVGSGIQLQTAKKLKVKNIFGTDINSQAVKHCKQLGFNCKNSNLFQNINTKFDLIIFNPPYLPQDKLEDKESQIVTTGGKKGSEIINEFLNQAKFHLNKNGKIFLLTSSLTKGIDFGDWKKKILAEKKLFFEKVFVLELD